jgi:membrane fusion protein, multidrug efflux system
LVPVQVGGTSGNDVVLIGGVKPGQTVVTAGVNLLKQGQKVKILPPERSATDTAPLVASVAPAAEGPK